MPASTNVGPTIPGASDFKHPRLKPGGNPAHVAPPQVSDAASGGGYPAQTHVVAPTPNRPPTPNQAAARAAASTQSSLSQYMNYLGSNMGRDIASLTQPIIKSYEAQAAAGDKVIQGLTQTYATQLGNIANQANAAYTQAEGQQASLDTAVGQALQNGDVGAAASKLKASLALAGQDTSPAVQAAQDASSTGAAMYAYSSAGLSQLFQDAAAQKAYGATLPGLANLAGIQAIGSYNANLTQAEQQAVQNAEQLYPSLLNAQTAQQNAQTSAYNAQTARAREQGNLAVQEARANSPKPYGNGQTGYFVLIPDGKGGYINKRLTAPGATKAVIYTGGNGQKYRLDPTTGQSVPLAGGAKPTTTKTQTNKNVGKTVVDGTGQRLQWDTKTGTYDIPVGKPKSQVQQNKYKTVGGIVYVLRPGAKHYVKADFPNNNGKKKSGNSGYVPPNQRG